MPLRHTRLSFDRLFQFVNQPLLGMATTRYSAYPREHLSSVKKVTSPDRSDDLSGGASSDSSICSGYFGGHYCLHGDRPASLYAIVTVPASISAQRLADDLALFKVTGGSRSRGRKTRTQRQKPYRQTITTIVTVTILSSASTKSRRYRATGCWRSTGH